VSQPSLNDTSFIPT